MPLYRDEAIVLRTHKLGESDRIITLLTRQHGRVRAVAKGVRRTTSRWGSRLEPFTHVDLQLAEGRNLDVVTQADTLDAFPSRLGDHYDRYTAGTVMLETADRLVMEEKEPALQQFLLLVGGLRAMTSGARTPAQVLLRWGVQHGMVTLPKSVHEARIVENASLFDFTLDDDAMKALDALDEGKATGWDPRDQD